MSKFNITNAEHLTTLDGQLKDNLYIGGHFPSAEDCLVLDQYTEHHTFPNIDTHLNLWSWFTFVSLFQPHIRQTWMTATGKQQEVKKTEKKPETHKPTTTTTDAPKTEVVKDETDDLFGDDDDADAAANLEAMKKKKADDKEKEKAKAGAKPGIIAKSLIVIDVKVFEIEQDLDALANRILAIERDGLVWKTEYKLNEVAFGIKKITIGCVVEDEKVSIDDINEEIESWEDDVQSVDIVSFNKL